MTSAEPGLRGLPDWIQGYKEALPGSTFWLVLFTAHISGWETRGTLSWLGDGMPVSHMCLCSCYISRCRQAWAGSGQTVSAEQLRGPFDRL